MGFQEALQREVVKISNGDQNLPSNWEVIMIILLWFLDLYMDALEVGTQDNNSDVCTRNTSS